MDDKKGKTISNLLWRFAERSGAQIVTFIVAIVLARILSPADYGAIALITVFTNILQVFVDSGLGTALVQKKEADDLDFSSVFYFNFAVCLFLYACMFLMAPYIAGFYKNTHLTPVIRVISLTLVISGVKNIQQAYVSRNLLFKRFFYATLTGTVFSAFLGIGMAYNGLGVWALVAQQLSNATIDTAILWLTVKWRPKKAFSWGRLRTLLGFAWKMLASALLDTVYNNLRSLIIGRAYSSADLAYYNQGQKFPNVIVTNINTSIDSVLLPVMANEQDDKHCVKKMTRKAIQTSSFIMWPAMVGLAVCARPLVSLVLTDKWLPCVPYLQIFCVAYAFYPVHTANLNAIKALGRSDVFLKLEIAKKMVGLLSIFITMPFGVFAMAIGLLATTPISVFINAFPNRTLLEYSFKNQMEDLIPYIGLSAIMGACIYPIQFWIAKAYIILPLQIFAGAAIYILGAKMMHFSVMGDLAAVIGNMRPRRAARGSLNGSAPKEEGLK
jgi:O-antigen/teichoic acid export membrane protein